jgi:hypothetical protein
MGWSQLCMLSLGDRRRESEGKERRWAGSALRKKAEMEEIGPCGRNKFGGLGGGGFSPEE